MASEFLNGQASVSVTKAADIGSMSLEKDSSGQDQEKGVSSYFIAVPPGILKFDSLAPGHAVIRLWDPNEVNPSLHVPRANTVKPNEVLGSRSDTITEALSFNNSREATLSKGRIAYDVSVIAQSAFIGGPVPTYSNGKFIASSPTTGSMIVEYKANYKAYKIYYGLPDWVIQRVMIEGQNVRDVTIPPLIIMAYAGGQTATLQIERKITTSTPPDCKDDEWKTSEKSIWVEYNVYPESEMDYDVSPPEPKAGANFLTSKAYVEHIQYCSQNSNRLKTQIYPVPTGDNIVIVKYGKGAV